MPLDLQNKYLFLFIYNEIITISGLHLFKQLTVKTHNVPRIGMKRTSISGLLHVVKGLSGGIFPCQLYLKHSKWQIYYNLIFLNQCHDFICNFFRFKKVINSKLIFNSGLPHVWQFLQVGTEKLHQKMLTVYWKSTVK